MEYSCSDPIEAYQGFFISHFLNSKPGEEGRYNFYCGITNNLERRYKEHNVAQYIHTVKMDSFDLAQEVEAMMHKAGYDTGEQLGNGQEDTVYVYLYRKIPGVTIETP